MKAKSIFAAMLFLAAAINVTGQSAPAGKGSNLFSGAFTFSTAGGDLYEDDGRMHSLSLSTSYANFVTDGLGIGGKLIWSSIGQGNYSYSTLAIGPQFLYFISSDYESVNVKGKVLPYIGTSFLYQFATSKWDDDRETANGYIYTLGGGIAIMMTNTVSLNIEAIYQGDYLDGDTGNKINFVMGLSAFL